MNEEYRLVSTKLLEFELQRTISPEQKATLASAISRLLHEAIAKRDALEVVHIQTLEARLDKLETVLPPFVQPPPPYELDHPWVVKTSNKKVFIVHGRNEAMKHATARAIEKLGLEGIVLGEMPNLNRALIDKFIDNAEAGYAVILLSPDDVGYLKEDGPENAKPRARQNVIFELGYFLGKMKRSNIAVLYLVTPNFEFPSDFLGVAYIPYDNYESWKYRLVEELKASGFDVDANRLLNTH